MVRTDSGVLAVIVLEKVKPALEIPDNLWRNYRPLDELWLAVRAFARAAR